MSKITSNNQKGGITAHTISLGKGTIQNNNFQDKPKMNKWIKYGIIIITSLSSIATIWTFLKTYYQF